MRIDKFLFFIRFAKSRSVASALVGEGRIRVDGKRVLKPSDEVRIGSIVAMPWHGEVRILEITALPARRGPAPEARTHYREIPANVSQENDGD